VGPRKWDPFGVNVNDELGETTRCLLFASPDEFVHPKVLPLQEHLAKAFAQQPLLAADVGKDAISVIHPASNAVITSAGLAQVTATPGNYAPVNESAEGSSRKYTQPLLILDFPGMQNLRIAILPMHFSNWTGQQFRYAWRGKARPRDLKSPALSPTHVVTDTQWLSLVEKFGLAALVVDEYTSGILDRKERFAKVWVSAFLALLFVASTVLLVWLVWAISTGEIHHHHR
jgi:hypothetical protein